MRSDPAFDRRPNVLLLHAHDLGRHLGCYGAGVETPAVDGLSDEGVRFDRSFCTAPQCSPSRGSLLTGQYPHNNGLMGLAHLGWNLDADAETLPGPFGRAGYETRLFGVQHESTDPESLGYDECWTASERADEVADAVTDFLGGGPDGPLFASVGFLEPHRLGRSNGWRFDAPRYDASDPGAVDVPAYLPDEPVVREELAAFEGMVRAVDDAVGRILDALDRSGLADRTLVVFTTDHGPAFPGAKGMVTDAGVGTALLARHPSLPSGESRDDLLSNVDLLPTLLDAVGEGERIPDGIDGRSFAPLLWERDPVGYDGRDRVFLEETFHDKYTPVRGVRTERYKYVRNFDDLPLVYLPVDVLHSPSGRALFERYYTEGRPEEELYDLRSDPLEERNLIDDPAYAEAADRLRTVVDDWLTRTDDPVLDGDVPVPPEHVEELKRYPWV